MLNRINKQLNKELKVVKEVNLDYFSFDDIVYLVQDSNGESFYLLISFDDKVIENCICSLSLENLFIFLLPYKFKYKKRHFGYKTGEVSFSTFDEFKKDNDFSLNKFNLLFRDKKSFVLLCDGKYLPFYIDGNKAVLGTWNNFFKRSTFIKFAIFIFENFSNVTSLEYKNLLYDPVFSRNNWIHPDFFIPLPRSFEELHNRLSKKPRQRTKRERAKLYENFSNVSFENIAFSEINEEIIDLYYKFAYERYGITQEKSNILEKNITDAYLLKLNNKIEALDFTCEQGKFVYWECGSYNEEFNEFSLGKVLYNLVLERMIEKHLKGVSIGSIPLDYKKHYGSIEFVVNSGEIGREYLNNIRHLKRINYSVAKFSFRFNLILSRLLKGNRR